MRIPITRVLLIGGIASALVLGWALPVTAHEERGVGEFDLVVGWGDEPTYTGYKNSVSVLVTEGGKPVNDVGDDLKVEVGFGKGSTSNGNGSNPFAQSTTLQLEPNFLPGVFGEEGDYRAWVTPTEVGEYSFRIFGTHDGQKIDETFTSGPNTFATPVDVQEIQFPTKEPSTGELDQKIERQLARVQASADETAAVGGDIEQLRSDLDGARLISTVAIVVALVAVGGLVAMAMTRRRAPAAPPTERTA